MLNRIFLSIGLAAFLAVSGWGDYVNPNFSLSGQNRQK